MGKTGNIEYRYTVGSLFFMETIFKRLGKPSILLVLFFFFILLNILLGHFIPMSLALDLRFAYSANEAYSSLKSMGATLREKYILVIWVVDTAYMVVYLLLFCSLIVRLLYIKFLLVLPFLIFILDLFENLTVTILLMNYPLKSQVLGLVASFFTTAKWLVVGVFCIAFITYLIRNYLLKDQPK